MTDGPGGAAPFPRDLLAGDTFEAARTLLGTRLVRDWGASSDDRRVGRIVEVEAYLGRDDRASHARMGRTPRNRVMFGPPGMAYVYLVYGMYHCLNVVTGPGGYPAALLIRAVEPLEGLAAMRAARGRPGVSDARLAAGPGLVGIAFGITRADTGLDLVDLAGPLHLEGRPAGEPAPVILTGPRVGIGSAGEPWTSLPWRYAIGGSAALSRPIG